MKVEEEDDDDGLWAGCIQSFVVLCSCLLDVWVFANKPPSGGANF